MAHYIGLLGKSLLSHIKWTCPHRSISHQVGLVNVKGELGRRLILFLV